MSAAAAHPDLRHIHGKPLLIGTNDTRGRFDQSLAIRVITGPSNERGHGLFRFAREGRVTD